MSRASKISRRAWMLGAAASTALPAVLGSSGRARALCAVPIVRLSLRGTITDARPVAAGLVVVRDEGPSRVLVADLDVVRWVGPGQTPYPCVASEVAEDVYVLAPSSPLAPGRYVLHGVSQHPIPVELTDTPLAPPAAPLVHALRRESSTERGSMGRAMSSATLRLTLRGEAPRGALALAEWQESGATQSTWGEVSATAPHATAILASTGRCFSHGRFPPAGARVTVRLLDLHGQLSPPSRPVRA